MDTGETNSRKLIMLMGSPRSGTTWLAKIIDSHPGILYRHEPDSINVRADIPFVPEQDIVTQYVDVSHEYLAVLREERASKSSGSQPMFPKSYRGFLGENFRRALIYGIKFGERIGGGNSFLSNIQIPDIAGRVGQGEPQVFIKSVSSLCRSYLFSLADPDLRCVHILRHPCAYVASTIRGKKLGLLSDDAYIDTLANMSGAAAYGLTREKLQSMSREGQLAARWMLQNEKVMQEMQESDRYRRVIYEDLCNRPQEVAEELFGFLGLDMEEQTRTFIAQSSGSQAGEARYFDVRRDSTEAASGWMKELSGQQIEDIERVVSNSQVGRAYFAD